jgi:hypothetical protein
MQFSNEAQRIAELSNSETAGDRHFVLWANSDQRAGVNLNRVRFLRSVHLRLIEPTQWAFAKSRVQPPSQLHGAGRPISATLTAGICLPAFRASQYLFLNRLAEPNSDIIG